MSSQLRLWLPPTIGTLAFVVLLHGIITAPHMTPFSRTI